MVGTIDHVLLDWRNPEPSVGFGETASTSLVMFLPRDAMRVENRDRIKYGGAIYAVVGGRLWDEPHPVTGHNFTHYAVRVESTA